MANRAALLLGALVEARGQLVTREDIQDLLWPGGKVEFDQGINFLVRQLRKTLGDSASEPRYIETFPRRGYRLVADVEVLPAESLEASPAAARRMSWVAVAIPLAIVAGLTAVALRPAGQPAASQPVASTPTVAAPVLAILPFSVPEAGGSDGIDARLTTELTRLAGPNARVLGATVTAPLSGSDAPVSGARGQFAACYLMGGALRVNDAGSTELFGQLLRTSDGAHVWARIDTLADVSLGAVVTDLAQRAWQAMETDLAKGARSSCP